MSYKCESCGVTQANGVACNLVPILFRDKEYRYIDKETKRPKVTYGKEIVREARLCAVCANKVAEELHRKV